MSTLLLAAAAPLIAQAALPALVWWALVFFIVAIVAYLLGARGVAGMSASVGRTLLFVFLVLAIVLAIVGFIQNA